MDKRLNPITLFSSLLLGSAFAKVVSRLVQKKFSLSILDNSIPGVTDSLSLSKTYDFSEFGLFIGISLLILFGNYVLIRFSRRRLGLELYYLANCAILFVIVNHMQYSAKWILISSILCQVFYFAAYRIRKLSFHLHTKSLVSGILLGVYFMLIFQLINIPFVFQLMFLLGIITLYCSNLLPNKLCVSSVHLLLIISILVPESIGSLLIIGMIVMILFVVTSRLEIKLAAKTPYQVYILTLLILVTYNPMFYVGSYDVVEEGFWIAWVYRISRGDVLYKDIYSYHPPLLTWLLTVFNNVFGYSLYNTRLFFHIFQVVGIAVVYFAIDRLLKSPFNKVCSIAMVLILTNSQVRNNVEIRVAMGLIVFLVYSSKLLSNKWRLFLSGVFTSIAILISFEVGASALVGMSTSLLIIENNKIQSLIRYYIGVIILLIPFSMYLSLNQALLPFIEQVVFYSKAFSSGYFNTPIDRIISTSLFRWHLLIEQLSTIQYVWEIVRMIMVGSLILIVYTVYILKSKLPKEKLIVPMTIFVLILTRSALGRSDWEHLLFVVVVAIPTLFYLLEYFTANKFAYYLVSFIGIFVVSQTWLANDSSYLSKIIVNMQSYGRPIGEYKEINIDKTDILVDQSYDDTQIEEVVNYVITNTATSDEIFTYPWMPEVYFLANRMNATNIDTPYSFYSDKYQKEIIEDLKTKKPLVIYNTDIRFGGMNEGSLKLLNEYITKNYEGISQINKVIIMQPRQL